MTVAKDKVVSIDYTLFDPKGEELDSSKGSGPLAYLHGADNIISGLEKALEGKTEGDKLRVTVAAAEAYGERDSALIVTVPKDRFEEDADIQVGMQFQAESEDGVRIVTVTSIGDDGVTIDANHPLAGVDLTFDVEVISVRDANPEELSHGHPHDGHSHHHECGDDCDCSCEDGEDGCCGSEGCGCH